MQEGTRTYLAQYFVDMAEWHSSDLRAGDNGSDEMPERRKQSSGFYRQVAEHIGTLPEDDLRLIALGRLTGFDEQIGFSPGPRVSAAIADVGQFVEGSPEPFLEYLVHAALDDQLDVSPHATNVLLESVELHGNRL